MVILFTTTIGNDSSEYGYVFKIISVGLIAIMAVFSILKINFRFSKKKELQAPPQQNVKRMSQREDKQVEVKPLQPIALSDREKKLKPVDRFAVYIRRFKNENLHLTRQSNWTGDAAWIRLNIELLQSSYEKDLGETLPQLQIKKGHNLYEYLKWRMEVAK